MCGFAGYITQGRSPSVTTIEGMTRSLCHRGPDSQGQLVRGPSALGASRLSIIGGSAADQPLRGERGSFLAWNGEIYNYRELSLTASQATSDSLVLHSLLESQGEGCLPLLRGPFSLAHLSHDGQSVMLARDEFAQKPLYYHGDGERLVFGSEVRALFAAGVPQRLNDEALQDYLAIQFYSPGRTLFAGVENVLPGQWIRFELMGGRVQKVSEGRFRYTDSVSSSGGSPEQTAALFEEACRLQLSSDVPSGIALSGGLDSTAVASALVAQGQQQLQGFVGYPTGAPELDERPWARIAAKRCGFPLQEIPISGADVASILPEVVRTLEMPVAGPGSLAQFIVAREASRSCRILFGGQGGDEVFGGYERMQLMQAIDRGESAAPNPLYQPLMDRMREAGGGLDSYFAAIHRGVATPAHRRLTMRRFAHLLPKTFSAMRVVDRAAAFEMKVQLPGLLHVDDRVTAHFGMESRSPLLDQRLVRYVSTQPMQERSPIHSPRDLFRRAFAAHLPTSIANRSDKMGFPLPVDRWLKSELRDLVGDAFLSQRALERGYLSRDYAMRLADMRGVGSREVFGHLMLELWHREYLDPSLSESEAKEAQGIA